MLSELSAFVSRVLAGSGVVMCIAGTQSAAFDMAGFFMEPRTGIQDDTVIVGGGQAQCAIVFPSGSRGYSGMVEKLQEAIEGRTGVVVEAYGDRVVVSEWFTVSDSFRKQHLILLGNLHNNKAMVQLVANYHMYATADVAGRIGGWGSRRERIAKSEWETGRAWYGGF